MNGCRWTRRVLEGVQVDGKAVLSIEAVNDAMLEPALSGTATNGLLGARPQSLPPSSVHKPTPMSNQQRQRIGTGIDRVVLSDRPTCWIRDLGAGPGLPRSMRLHRTR